MHFTLHYTGQTIILNQAGVCCLALSRFSIKSLQVFVQSPACLIQTQILLDLRKRYYRTYLSVLLEAETFFACALFLLPPGFLLSHETGRRKHIEDLTVHFWFKLATYTFQHINGIDSEFILRAFTGEDWLFQASQAGCITPAFWSSSFS